MQHSALMYHDVVRACATSGRDTGIRDRYALSWDGFVEHLDRTGASVSGRPSASEDPDDPVRDSAWSLTFADGGASAVDVGHELARRGWHGYFFIATGLVGSPGFVNPDGIRELHALGHVVGSHTVTHPPRLSALPEEEIYHEWSESVQALTELLSQPVYTGSIPGGSYSRHVATAAARAGIRVLFTSKPTQSVARVDGCLVVGRYSIVGRTSSAQAAAAASGDRRGWLQRSVEWNVRGLAKAGAGSGYDSLRRRVLARRDEG